MHADEGQRVGNEVAAWNLLQQKWEKIGTEGCARDAEYGVRKADGHGQRRSRLVPQALVSCICSPTTLLQKKKLTALSTFSIFF